MKRIISVLLLLPALALSQSQDQNYARTTSYKIPVTTDVASPAPDTAAMQVTYFDGLGRAIQQVAAKQSSSGKDIITHIEYDPFGRQGKDYLPYESGSADELYDPDALANTLGFYTSYNGGASNPYNEKFFEASPQSRILKLAAPGNDWRADSLSDDDHTIKFGYSSNKIDEVRYLEATATWNASSELYDTSVSDNGYYPPDVLYKTVVKDENWTGGNNNTSEEFKDKMGRLILKRNYNESEPYDTYYIYDPYGNLSYVVPPKAAQGGDITPFLDELCYQYNYDFRNRLVQKKLPGRQWEFIIYDRLDRVVATGPALSPFSNLAGWGWLVTKYDDQNRPILTAWLPDTVNDARRANLQYSRNIETGSFNEHKTDNGGKYTINGVSFWYTSKVWPLSGYHVLSVQYYDDYDFPDAPATLPAAVLSDAGQPVNAAAILRGLATGSWVRVPETSLLYKATTGYILYDDKYRPVRNYTANYLGGFTKVDSKVDFSGKTLYTETTHKRLAASSQIYVKDNYTYSDQDRLLSHTHQVGTAGIPQLLAQNEYDALGVLASKKQGGTNASAYFQNINYSYNIRGWLTGINDTDDFSIGTDPIDLFAFKINYNTVEDDLNQTVHPLYNGNISETFWRSNSDRVLRKYGYSYDGLNRLTAAVYQKPDGHNPVPGSYNESVQYDKNGNITALQRKGALDSDVFTIDMDDLSYTYGNSGQSNRLLKVDDATNNPGGFADGSGSGDDYGYDDNGNLTSDHNKGISGIIYNQLDLPVKIIFGLVKKIDYLYDATGAKLQKTVTDNTTVTITDYLDGFQYTNGALDFISFEGGYVKNTITAGENNYNYIFNYTDHLGNIRMNYSLDQSTNNLKIMEESHYYPFGLQHANYNNDLYTYVGTEEDGYYAPVVRASGSTSRNSYQYKYNGKEYQDELGLNMYDYGARNYDPAIGRWMNIDPLAEKGRRWSPYAYAMDNPIYFVDPDGMWPWPTWSQVKGFASNLGQGAVNYGNKTVNHFKNEVSGLKSAYANIATNPKATLKFAVEHSGPAIIANAIISQVETPLNILNKVAKGDIKGATQDYGEHLTAGAVAWGTAGALKGGTNAAATEPAAAGETSLYRAVSNAELTDISKNGLNTTAGGYETAKLFTNSAENAAQFGKNNFAVDGIPNTIIEAKVPQSVMNTATSFSADGMPATAIPAEQLQNIKNITSMNSSPIPRQ